MTTPTWLVQLEEARGCALAGVVLRFNTADRVFGALPDAPPMGLRYFLATWLHHEGLAPWYYALSTGLAPLLPPGGWAQDQQRTPPADDERLTRLVGSRNLLFVLDGLGTVLRDQAARVALILDYADHLAPEPGPATVVGLAPDQLATVELLHAWSLDDDIRRSGNFLVLIDQHNGLSRTVGVDSGYQAIDIDLPDEPTRLGFTRYLGGVAGTLTGENGAAGGGPGAVSDGQRLGQLAADFTGAAFARATSGLRLMDIEALFRHAGATGQPVNPGTVRKRKQRTIRELAGGLIEVVEPSPGFAAVAGLAHARRYFEGVRLAWHAGLASLPQAVLLAGVPGSGKSFLVRAVAGELDCPCLVMRGVREMWVGQSERNLDRVLHVLDNLAPCILWTDEIDQMVGGERGATPAGDAGTSARLFGRLLEYFGDARIRGRVLWIATTNRPDLLDTAIKDRFSVRIPFLHPDLPARAELLPALAAQVGRRLAEDLDPRQAAASPRLARLTVRALQEVIVWAGQRADRIAGHPDRPISSADLAWAIADYQPTADPLEHELAALTALSMTSFGSLLPWATAVSETDGVEGTAMVPPAIAELVDGNGRPDPIRLHRRIRECQTQRLGLSG